MRGMNEMSERLRTARIAAGFGSVVDAARALGVSKTTYAAHENGQNNFKEPAGRVYAERFGVRPAWLMLGEGAMKEDGSAAPAPAPTARLPKHPSNASPPIPVDYGTQRLGMFGQAVGGADGKFVLNGQRVMDVLCPPQLFNVPNAYGVFMHGDSMENRYFAGEAVFVNPHVPVRRGDFVVVQIAGEFDGDDVAGYVKRFISMNSRELVLEQFKPREDIDADAPEADRFTLRFPRDKVVAVHKIIASGEV